MARQKSFPRKKMKVSKNSNKRDQNHWPRKPLSGQSTNIVSAGVSFREISDGIWSDEIIERRAIPKEVYSFEGFKEFLNSFIFG